MSEQHEPFAFDFTSRYGRSLPNPTTVCRGPCEGMGLYPVFRVVPGVRIGEVQPTELVLALTPHERQEWDRAHRRCSLIGRVSTLFNLRGLWKFGPGPHFREVFSRCDGWHFVRCSTCSGTGVRRLS